MKANKLLIIDFGSQYTQLIARRVRELGVLSLVISIDDFLNYKKFDEIFGIILSGGPDSVYKSKDYLVIKSLLKLNLPVLGICYGMHILIKALGGKVEKANYREYGRADIKFKKKFILFKNIYSKNSSINVWMSHGDSVTKTPQGVNVIASNKSTPVIAFSFKKNNFGLQFHPEVTHTNQGKKIIHNYLFEVCKSRKLWTIRNIERNLIDDIKNTVGNKKVILGLSGGVDSSVSAVLIHKAIGSQLKCVFVDTGLIRINEKEEYPITTTKMHREKILSNTCLFFWE